MIGVELFAGNSQSIVDRVRASTKIGQYILDILDILVRRTARNLLS